MLWMQATTEEAGLFWSKVFFGVVERWWDKWAGGLKVLTVPSCPLSWDLFLVMLSSDLPGLLVKSALLCKTCRFLLGFACPFDCFWVMPHAALFCRTLWIPASDCKTEMGCSFSAALTEVLECVRLKGKGLGRCFSFLALPCKKTGKCWKLKPWLIQFFKSRGEWETYSQRFLLPFTARQAKVGGSWKRERLCEHRQPTYTRLHMSLFSSGWFLGILVLILVGMVVCRFGRLWVVHFGLLILHPVGRWLFKCQTLH